MSRTVIVPLDGSEASEQSIPFARLLAARQGAALTYLSVLEITSEFDAWIDTAPFTLEQDLDAWVAERREYLGGLDGAAGVDVNAVVRVGRPAEEIRAVADEAADPLIVLASHGRGGIQQFVLGSVALDVVHRSPHPVVIVHMQDDPVTPATLDRILFPLDGSDLSEQIIDRTLAIAGEPKPALHLLRVLETPSWATQASDSSLVAQYVEASREEAERALAAQKARLEALDYATTWEVRAGAPAAEILDAASEQGASMIAMATHGRGGIGRLLLGSVAQRVLHRTSVPLLLIRPNAG